MARRSTACLAGLLVYFLLYLAALAFAVVGSRGLFGFEENETAAFWLICIGMPWTLVLGLLPADAVPEIAAQAYLAFVPLLNLWVLRLACGKRRRRR